MFSKSVSHTYWENVRCLETPMQSRRKKQQKTKKKMWLFCSPIALLNQMKVLSLQSRTQTPKTPSLVQKLIKCEKTWKIKSFFGHLYLIKKVQLLVKNEFFHLDFDFTMQLGNKKVTFFFVFCCFLRLDCIGVSTHLTFSH